LELLNVFEVDYSWYTVLLSLHLHSHKVLHVHELIWHHSCLLELLTLWVLVLLSLSIEHDLHIHVRIHIHALAWEGHLILHHHTIEWVHILHAIHHRAWLRHFVVHFHTSHFSTCTWLLLNRSEFSLSVSILALVSIFAKTVFFEMSA